MPFQKATDPDKAITAYVAVCHGYPIDAINNAILKFLRGGFEYVSKRFCPTPPELSDMLRDVMPDKLRDNAWPEDLDPVTAAIQTWKSPDSEAKARVDEIMRKYRNGIPVNVEVERHWAKMQPFWQSGNPAYAGISKGTPPPPRRSADERLADLLAHANDLIEVTPLLEKKLEEARKQDEASL